MIVPSKFDDIRPFEPEELPEVFDRLLGDQQFRSVLSAVFPDMPLEVLETKIRGCKTNLEFQMQLCYGFLKQLLSRASNGYDINVNNIDTSGRYTFVSNHRDIVLDSALLDVMLIENGFTTTCEIAIGDNLLAAPWIKDLVRVNKSFIVKRSAVMREMLMNSKTMSEYMHFVIREKHDNIWIAQREGRAKDSDDRTQESILKMMAMGGEGTIIDRLKQLNIVPVAISYEYDPCDYLKAAEFQLKRDVDGWKKSKADDVMSMKTGIMGYKGAIHYNCAPCINDFLDSLAPETPNADLFTMIAKHIDSEIHRHYRLYHTNERAVELMRDTSLSTDPFDQYIIGQLKKIDIPQKDDKFLIERMLTMYANPAINKLMVTT